MSAVQIVLETEACLNIYRLCWDISQLRVLESSTLPPRRVAAAQSKYSLTVVARFGAPPNTATVLAERRRASQSYFKPSQVEKRRNKLISAANERLQRWQQSGLNEAGMVSNEVTVETIPVQKGESENARRQPRFLSTHGVSNRHETEAKAEVSIVYLVVGPYSTIYSHGRRSAGAPHDLGAS